MLSGVNGLTLCQQIRQKSNVPIIFLTAKVEEVDELLGYKLGADDYVTKPFSPKVLMAKIAAILNRSTKPADNKITLSFERIVMDDDKHEVTVAQSPVVLTLNEYNLLRTLLSQPNKVFSRKELLLDTKQVELDIYQRTIDTHLKNLRKKLAEANNGVHYIKSVYGIGYQLTSER
jgi:two-component system response regulator BaeR